MATVKWAGRLTAAIAAAELPVVLLVSPALLFPTFSRLLITLLVPVTWVCHRRLTGRLVPSTPLNLPVIVLLIMAGISLFATFDIRFSLGKVSGLLFGALLFWAVTRWTITTTRLSVAVAMFVAAGAGLAVLGLLGTNWLDKFPMLDAIVARLPRAIRGVPGAEEGFHPNPVAGLLILVVPLQVALLATSTRLALPAALGINHPRSSMLIQSGLLLLTLGTVGLTQSRGAWVGLVAATAAFFAWYGWRTRVLAALGAAALVVLASTFGWTRLLDLAVSRSGPGMAENLTGRLELWSRALYGIQDFPMTGMGMNAFRKVMPVLYPAFLSSPDFDVAHAHNHLLQAALDLGLPGLVAYLSIWLTVAALLVRVYRGTNEPTYRIMAGGLGAGLIAHFVFNMTDVIPLGSKAGGLFWLTLALVVALHQVSDVTGRSRVQEAGNVRG